MQNKTSNTSLSRRELPSLFPQGSQSPRLPYHSENELSLIVDVLDILERCARLVRQGEEDRKRVQETINTVLKHLASAALGLIADPR